jgi:hypothetical protein
MDLAALRMVVCLSVSSYGLLLGTLSAQELVQQTQHSVVLEVLEHSLVHICHGIGVVDYSLGQTGCPYSAVTAWVAVEVLLQAVEEGRLKMGQDWDHMFHRLGRT